jgi:hypothetical protein
MRSVSSDEYDCCDNECRDQRKGAIFAATSGGGMACLGGRNSPTSQPTSADFIGSDAIAIFSMAIVDRRGRHTKKTKLSSFEQSSSSITLNSAFTL